jgi:hypothetical protein
VKEDDVWILVAIGAFLLLSGAGSSLLSGLTGGVSANTVALANISANQQNAYAGDATSVLNTVLNDFN